MRETFKEQPLYRSSLLAPRMCGQVLLTQTASPSGKRVCSSVQRKGRIQRIGSSVGPDGLDMYLLRNNYKTMIFLCCFLRFSPLSFLEPGGCNLHGSKLYFAGSLIYQISTPYFETTETFTPSVSLWMAIISIYSCRSPVDNPLYQSDRDCTTYRLFLPSNVIDARQTILTRIIIWFQATGILCIYATHIS